MPPVSKPKPKAAAGKRISKKTHQMPEKIEEGTVFTDLHRNQWRIGPSIGVGGFGEIYSASKFEEKKYDYVIKCEPFENGTLFVEVHFYMRNAKFEDVQKFQRDRGLKTFGMPHLVGYGSTMINGLKHRFIVLPRFAKDIAGKFVANGRKLPVGTSYRIAIQMLDVYEYIHSRGYVHADLKAANILIGCGKAGTSQAYLVDFGLATHFVTGEFKPDPKKMHNGTIEYTSRDAHLGVETRRGDLEILAFNLVEWLGGTLPWVAKKLLKEPKKVQEAKINFMNDVNKNLKSLFPKGVPRPLVDYMNYIVSLGHNEQPNYDYCRKIFADGLKVLKISNSGPLNLDVKDSINNNTTAVESETDDDQGTGDDESDDQATGDDESDDQATGDDESGDESGDLSSDDDEDVIFEKTKPIKNAPGRKLKEFQASIKTLPQKKTTTPPRKTVRKPVTTPASIETNKSRSQTKPTVSKRTPKTAPLNTLRLTRTRTSPLLSVKTPTSPKALQRSATKTSLRQTQKTQNSPRINSSIVASSKSPPRPKGKTIINDNVTPSTRPVNVKRKKPSTTGSKAVTKRSEAGTTDGSSDSPAVSAKIRRVVKDGSEGPSRDVPVKRQRH